MMELESLTLTQMLDRSIRCYGEKKALATVGNDPITYNDLEHEINKVITFLESIGIDKGDKIAILSANMPNWAISFFAFNKMGVISVPLLPDFSIKEIESFLNHSETFVIFVSESLMYKVDHVDCPLLKTIVRMEDYKIMKGDGLNDNYRNGNTKNYNVGENDLVSIIYTSGTTGKSKGVMLTHKNVVSNAIASGKVQEILPSDRFLSILPLSHAYENTIGLIVPIMYGACVYYLSKPPTPAVLMPAMKLVKPTFMLSVPMVIEKIYRKKVLAEINKKAITRFLYKIPLLRKKFNALAGKKLKESFGGELKFFGIGGAKLDVTVEKFLREASFPYAIGYGLTETSPLLAGVNPQNTRLQSTGGLISGVTYKLGDVNPENGEGELWVKGDNIMKGYYKEPELTKEAFTEDGWLKTGDLVSFDEQGNVYVKGRKKSTIVGANGENIYPEEIESVINNFNYVLESLVVEKKGKLVALVHFNREELEEKYQHLKDEVTHFVEQKINELITELHHHVNNRVNKFSKLQVVMAHHEPFQKTATQKIKRYMYN